MNLVAPPYERLWRRLGLPEVWGWPLFWFTAVITGAASYAFDAVRLDNYSPSWITINLISLGAAVLYAASLVKLSKTWELNQSQRAGVNVFIAATAMGFKNLLTFMLCGYFGIADSGVPLVRFLGGVSIGLCLLVIYSNMRGAKIERLAIQRELHEKEDALIGFRENATLLFEEEEQTLIKKSAQELLPRFIQLQEQVEIGEDVEKLKAQLEKLLVNEVRPLSSSLAAEAKSLRGRIPSKKLEVVSSPDSRLNLGATIRVTSTTLLFGFAWAMLSPIILPEASVTDLAIASFLFFVCLLAIKGIYSLLKSVSVNQALFFATFPGLIAGLLPYYLIIQIPHQAEFDDLMPTFLISAGLASLALGLAAIIDTGRDESERKLKALLASFSRENKLFEQRLWVAQHVWYTLLHGTVQSALTAAMIRSSGKETFDEQDKKTILADLNRAISALRNPTREDVKFGDGIAAIQATWQDIAVIEFEVQQEAMSVIQASADGSLIVNEILKEAISNAVKHASASQIKIKIDLTEDKEASIVVRNNGAKPNGALGKGVGSALFETLCTEYSLSYNSNSETEFKAIVPIA